MDPNHDTQNWCNAPVSRRTTLLVAGAVAGGLGSAGLGSAETRARADDDPVARMYASDFHPGARFTVVSKPLEYKPHVPVQEGEAFLEGLYWSGYETRIAKYGNTAERVLFFPPRDAVVAPGRRYRMGEIRSTKQLAEGVIAVTYRQAEEVPP